MSDLTASSSAASVAAPSNNPTVKQGLNVWMYCAYCCLLVNLLFNLVILCQH
jgi:hypothetical protein